MTTITEAAPASRRSSLRTRFVLAFVVGIVAVLVAGVGALYAYDRSYAGRILPGVRVGLVDVSGLGPEAARQALLGAYAPLAEGRLVLRAPDGTHAVDFARLGRAPDVDAMLNAALTAGRSGGFLDHFVGNARTALQGAVVEPRVLVDEASVDAVVAELSESLRTPPVDAVVTRTDTGWSYAPATPGRRVDDAALRARILEALAPVDAPSDVVIDVPLVTEAPRIESGEAQAAVAQAQRMLQNVRLSFGDEALTITREQLLPLVTVRPTVDGGLVPSVEVAGIREILTGASKEIRRSPRSATFEVTDGEITGVIAHVDGRALSVSRTLNTVLGTLLARRDGTTPPAQTATVVVREPALTTAEAEAAAPLMERVSTWTTWFPIGEKNGFGANIWIPAMDIDGHVVAPGEWFDFWDAVGPVTRERGYRDGGAIINGRTEPQGALAGGICSTSTTLFNAALRAGFEMGDRRNHYYYIDRYPLGLDATVFKSSSGAVQTMRWRNDTDYPVLIRGFRIQDGGRGYVRFDLYSVPNGRQVALSRPIVKNVRPASDSTQLTSTLPAGTTKRIEYPVDGKDVWVTRTVRDANGNVIHQETYYSHYARITGIVLVGTGGSEDPAPAPAPGGGG
ncbi:MAG TPA: VanW family protein [Candidatus Limnocylindrales bacterium]|nr:VanW family protein [Candidatus Limnocylindrales bacterium]